MYYGHECEFVPERPVPVLRYRVSGWPEKAYEAEILLKFTLDRLAGNNHSKVLDLSQATQIEDFVENVTFYVMRFHTLDEARAVVDIVDDWQDVFLRDCSASGWSTPPTSTT